MQEETKIIIHTKSEAYPIGDVIALTVTWKEDERIIGEFYFANEKSQDKITKERCSVSKNASEHLSIDIEKELVARIKKFHKSKNLLPAMEGISLKDFNPYDENRFSWKRHTEKDIYLFLENYGQFFDVVESCSKNETIKEKISMAKRIKSLFVVEPIEDCKNTGF